MKIYIITKYEFKKRFKNLKVNQIFNDDIQKSFTEINPDAFEMLFNTQSLKDDILIKII